MGTSFENKKHNALSEMANRPDCALIDVGAYRPRRM
jgi:hypothetical protein